MTTDTIEKFDAETVTKAVSLDALCTALNAAEDYMDETGQRDLSDLGIDVTSLPVFGGEEPSSTWGVYSWNETSVLRFDPEWYVEKRPEPESDEA